MPCPICDQKPMNCDCTAEERRQYGEIEELRAEIARLRLTDAEREAVEVAIRTVDWTAQRHTHAATLRGLLERMSPPAI